METPNSFASWDFVISRAARYWVSACTMPPDLPKRKGQVKNDFAETGNASPVGAGIFAHMAKKQAIKQHRPVPNVYQVDAWMKYRGMTPAEFARRLNVSQPFINKWREKGWNVKEARARQIAEVLGCGDYRNLKYAPGAAPSVDAELADAGEDVRWRVLEYAKGMKDARKRP